jgi:hypothetical protein
MKKHIVTDPVWICGSDLIGSDIQNFRWEARMYGIWHIQSTSDTAFPWKNWPTYLGNDSDEFEDIAEENIP